MYGQRQDVVTQVANGQSAQVRVTADRELIISGGGTPGTPSGGVMSVQSAGRLTPTVTIANGASLSGAVDLGSASLVGIVMPAAWTAADLSFQVSADGVTYGNLFDTIGAEYLIPSASAVAGQTISIPIADLLGWRYLKVRSGPAAAAVAQGAARVLTLTAIP